jgi:hypothetical protein
VTLKEQMLHLAINSMMQWQNLCPSLRVLILGLNPFLLFLFYFILQVAAYEDPEDGFHEDY